MEAFGCICVRCLAEPTSNRLVALICSGMTKSNDATYLVQAAKISVCMASIAFACAMLFIGSNQLPASAQHPLQGLPWVQPSQRSTRGDALKILFVAHSKFFMNDMPTLFVGLAEQKAAQKLFKVISVYGVGYTLDHHLKKNLQSKRCRIAVLGTMLFCLNNRTCPSSILESSPKVSSRSKRK